MCIRDRPGTTPRVKTQLSPQLIKTAGQNASLYSTKKKTTGQPTTPVKTATLYSRQTPHQAAGTQSTVDRSLRQIASTYAIQRKQPIQL